MTDRPTLKQLSALAGVSTFTVSRALGSGDGVSTETRERVQELADRLGYVPNQMARNFRSNSSNFIGVLTANSENRFYDGIVASFQRMMLDQGYSCFVTDAVADGQYSIPREDLFVSAMLEQRAAGVVLAYVPTARNLDRLREFAIPLVFVDCAPPDNLPGVASVTSDGRSAAEEAGRIFAAQGRRSWLLVAHDPNWSTRRARQEGFAAAAAKAGAEVTVLEGGNDIETASNAVLAWLNDGGTADAVLCTNELLLCGALEQFERHGLRVPQDMAVISFDDFPWAERLPSPATVIAQPTHEMGERAADFMLDLIRNRRTGAQVSGQMRDVMATQLIRRRSCGL